MLVAVFAGSADKPGLMKRLVEASLESGTDYPLGAAQTPVLELQSQGRRAAAVQVEAELHRT